VIELLQEISGKEIAPTFLDERLGDIKHSIADINKAKDIIDYNPTISFEVGMKIVYNWYKSVVIRNNS
jgi:UDP-glucose 4-epimerase